ncbi:hypothetical protein ACGFZK_03510 [Streptomyces sp. NPDC048257]|uniref:hypothetical protein n=1 Tax=Streptomyces sp. NPDC048257 TaxID=3365526 RepID=UPI00371826E8
MGTSGEDRRTHGPSKEEVLAAVESPGLPSTAEEVAERVDAMAGHGDGASPASVEVEAVLGLLRELERTAQVKSYTPEQWRALGVRTARVAPYTRLWWSVDKWRETAVAGAQRYQENRRGDEPQWTGDREGPVRKAVDRMLEQRRRRERSRNPFEGPGAG